ncbi:MAG TPA: retropepsin-like aspartic protease [Pyrinomonadaceae bacterium]|jgi:hypothetical protein|nr:retropepsin-like aspartic protease [Pyrinomonadaceae bacterium]
MHIRYRKVPDNTRPEGYALYPLLQAFVRSRVNMQGLLALVDSGASDCIFPQSLGDVLGIDVPSGKPHEFQSFNAAPVPGYVHKVSIQIADFSTWLEIEAVFIESECVPILGQIGFFDHYQIVFERFRKVFEVNTKEGAVIRNIRGHGKGRRRNR